MTLRWQLPNSEGAVVASTANDLRQDKHAPINPEKLKAAAAGLTQSKFSFMRQSSYLCFVVPFLRYLDASEHFSSSDFLNFGWQLDLHLLLLLLLFLVVLP